MGTSHGGRRPAEGQLAGRLTVPRALLPDLLILVALAVGAAVALSTSVNRILLWGGFVLLALVAIRQGVVLARTIRLANALEHRLEARSDELDDEKAFLVAVLDCLEEGVVVCDADGVLTAFNDAIGRLHDPENVVPEPIPTALWAEHYGLRQLDGVTRMPTEQIPLVRALRGESVRDLEMVIAPAGGPHRLVHTNGRAVVGRGGKLLGAVTALHDITDRRRAQLDLEHQAFHDPLTGLGNRARFDASVPALLLIAQAERKHLTVLLADLDDFNRVNDGLGHVTGDLLLAEVGRRLRSCVRDCDLSVRLGGDEFAFVLEDSSPADGVAVARRMLDVLAPPIAVGGAEVLVTSSIGIVSDSYRTDARQLLRGADLAMYEAKHTGKGRYVVFDPAMQVLADGRLTLESEMRAALRDDDFRLVYQPVVDLATGSMTGVEALLRLDAPGRATMSPADFIPVAEQTGLIVPLGDWVLREACSQLARWDTSLPGCPRLTMAVNVSLTQLDRPGFAETIRTTLEATGLDATRLVLEITESALRDDEHTAGILRSLHETGVSLSIDDFGTGYSTLARLRTSSVDYIKLDRSFVAEIDGAEAEAPIVHAMVAMARGLGLRTIGEGIETSAQLTVLTGLGCDEGQGYLMSRPVAPEAIAELLSSAGSLV